MSFTASFTAYQRVGSSRRTDERGGEDHRRQADPSGGGAEGIGEGPASDGPATA